MYKKELLIMYAKHIHHNTVQARSKIDLALGFHPVRQDENEVLFPRV